MTVTNPDTMGRHRAASDGDIISHIVHHKSGLSPNSPGVLNHHLQNLAPIESRLFTLPRSHHQRTMLSPYEMESKIFSPGMYGIEASWREWRIGEDEKHGLKDIKEMRNHEVIESEDFKLIDEESSLNAQPGMSVSVVTSSGPFELQHIKFPSYSSKLDLLGSPSTCGHSSSPDMLTPNHSGVSTSFNIKSIPQANVVLTFCIFLISILPALMIPNVSSVWTIIGSFLCPIVAFIIPSLSYMCIYWRKGIRIDATFIVCAGLFVISIIVTTFLTLQNIL